MTISEAFKSTWGRVASTVGALTLIFGTSISLVNYVASADEVKQSEERVMGSVKTLSQSFELHVIESDIERNNRELHLLLLKPENERTDYEKETILVRQETKNQLNEKRKILLEKKQ